jgi:hypothetical protein
LSYESPSYLLHRLKIGREEFCQRLLTMLVLGAEYPKWNTRNIPSARGLQFLRRLHELCFGAGEWSDQLEFIDELELAPRTESEKGGGPDQAVIWTNRLWMIELPRQPQKAEPTAGSLPGPTSSISPWSRQEVFRTRRLARLRPPRSVARQLPAE